MSSSSSQKVCAKYYWNRYKKEMRQNVKLLSEALQQICNSVTKTNSRWLWLFVMSSSRLQLILPMIISHSSDGRTLELLLILLRFFFVSQVDSFKSARKMIILFMICVLLRDLGRWRIIKDNEFIERLEVESSGKLKLLSSVFIVGDDQVSILLLLSVRFYYLLQKYPT